ncbi:hypothetical protein [Stutzerimonas kunmingensis]|nr:hypothetical protein [Stutzerimonas kunmingensis]
MLVTLEISGYEGSAAKRKTLLKINRADDLIEPWKRMPVTVVNDA